MIGLICATDDELAAILAQGRETAAPQVIAGERFFRIRLGAEAREVVVTRTQIGKVNAALAATLLVALPDLACTTLVMVGVAGGLAEDLSPGDTVAAVSVGCHDYGAVTEAGFQSARPGAFPLNGPPARPEDVGAPARRLVERLLARVEQADAPPGWRLRAGGVVSGDLFISSETVRRRLRAEFGADVADMESHAVWQVCQRFGVPLVILRSVSDEAGANAVQQYLSGIAHTCDRAASYLPALMSAIGDGEETH